jgi:sulfate adenylyltransferase large subunit
MARAVAGNGHAKTTARTSELLRIATAGSVDDGKSTLIGRLLYDSKQVLVDQLEHVTEVSARRGDGYVNLALLTDGLRAEREQGITIDVAYRYFQTARRKFILADTPGHVQYTRNMVTGASTADLALILIDARSGVVEQTRRHTFIASLLGIPHLVVAVNKMDLVGYDEARFDEIVREFCALRGALSVKDVAFIPISALHGDNVVDRSEAMDWYGGLPMLEHLETVEVERDRDLSHQRFPVQWVIRPGTDEHHDYRGYAGQVAGGVLHPGDPVVVLPSGIETSIAAIDTADGELASAIPPQSVTLRLADDVDVSRGDLIAGAGEPPRVTRELEADVCWFADAPLRAGARYAIKQTTAGARVVVDAIVDRLDVATLEREDAPQELALNDIGRVRLRTSRPLAVDPYEVNRTTGSFILIDEATNDTVAGGMVR